MIRQIESVLRKREPVVNLSCPGGFGSMVFTFAVPNFVVPSQIECGDRGPDYTTRSCEIALITKKQGS
jgi:hypothetical protein